MTTTLVELVAADGVRLAARRWPAASASSGTTVVIVHGFAASGSEPRVSALAAALTEQGHAVLTYDSRGHGESGGEATLGTDERLDVAAAVDAVAPGPIVLVGASMGAISVLRYTADTRTRRDRDLRGVVVVSCPARWTLPRNARGVLSALMTMTPVGRWCARRYMNVRIAPPRPRPAPPLELVGDVDVPIAIVHGRDDPFIAAVDAEAIHGAAKEPRRLEIVTGLGHAFEGPSIEPVLEAVNWVHAQPGPPRAH